MAERGAGRAVALSQLFGLDPHGYQPHRLHDKRSGYPETNCYADLMIELLHARGDEPLAVLGSVVELDFEGDQFTFLKPPPDELRDLLGIEVHEMQPYRGLPVQLNEQLIAGRTMTVEVDSWWLPDTVATSYRTEHVKTSIAVEAVDVAAERMHYFHGGGLYSLDGEDFRGALRLDATAEQLPPYVELVRFDAGPRLGGAELRAAAADHVRAHLRRAPDDAFDRFATSLAELLPALQDGAVDFHAYAFATVRMVGSSAAVGAAFAEWLLDDPESEAAQRFAEASVACTALMFRLARRRAFDSTESVAVIGRSWMGAVEALDARVS